VDNSNFSSTAGSFSMAEPMPCGARPWSCPRPRGRQPRRDSVRLGRCVRDAVRHRRSTPERSKIWRNYPLRLATERGLRDAAAGSAARVRGDGDDQLYGDRTLSSAGAVMALSNTAP